VCPISVLHDICPRCSSDGRDEQQEWACHFISRQFIQTRDMTSINLIFYENLAIPPCFMADLYPNKNEWCIYIDFWIKWNFMAKVVCFSAGRATKLF
jgi:hypothetical protein